ncbi:MAG: hypothetical protein GWN00_34175 [Aliifodinibius sp.]|nr:hypothetical protein [Phycisphaerae bacterium]NIT61072.1 hypothetical protein [Fodinibius sp.]NIY29652.1 hypothetical protein [Fodinibius sp.]
MLTDKERDELLIRMDERVGQMNRHMKVATSEKGFARCQVHRTEVEGLKKDFTRYRRIVYGILTTILSAIGLKMLANWLGIFPPE